MALVTKWLDPERKLTQVDEWKQWLKQHAQKMDEEAEFNLEAAGAYDSLEEEESENKESAEKIVPEDNLVSHSRVLHISLTLQSPQTVEVKYKVGRKEQQCTVEVLEVLGKRYISLDQLELFRDGKKLKVNMFEAVIAQVCQKETDDQASNSVPATFGTDF